MIEIFLFVPILISDAQTQIIFKDSFKTSFILSFDSRSTDRKTIDIQTEYQDDIESAEEINSSNSRIVAHQTAVRVRVPNEA